MKPSFAQRVRAKLGRDVGALATRLRIRMASRHVAGPLQVALTHDEVGLTCMLKNGAYYLPELLEHHRALGVRHFLIIDNGSDDDTVAIASAHQDVTVIANPLPARIYESALRAQIAQRVFRGGWLLFVDSDELAEMPHGEGRPISDFTHYCNLNGYEVVVGQSLDLFSAAPLNDSADWDYSRSIREFDRYSLHDIRSFPYHDTENVAFSWFLRDNAISNPEIGIKFGGIRREIFGEDCCLTHHRLVRNRKDVAVYTHPHCCSNASCADFTLLTRHYKFAGPFLQRERDQIASGTWSHGEDEKRIAMIKDDAFAFKPAEPRRYTGTAKLVEEGFLDASAAFKAVFPAP